MDDTITLYQADGISLVDQHSWAGGHAGTTFGRCPDGVGAWQETTVSTRGTANACSPIRVNEITSDPVDSVELVNLSGADIDVAGWVIEDSTDTNPTTLPSPSVVPANGHLLVTTLDPQLTTNAGPPGAMDVTWDPEQQCLWALCDDSCDGVSVTMALDDAGAFGVTAAYDRPLGMPNLNNEGMALAPQSTCINGSKEVVWTDDGDTDSHSLRTGTITCEPAPTTPPATPTTPTTPTAPVTPTPTTPTTTTPTTTTPAAGKQVARITTARKTVRGSTGTRMKVRPKDTTGTGPATGRIKVRIAGTKVGLKSRLEDGRAVVRLPRFARVGTKKVVVTYLGNTTTQRDRLRLRAVIRGNNAPASIVDMSVRRVWWMDSHRPPRRDQ